MDDNRLIQNLRTLPYYHLAMEKLTTDPARLDENEKAFLLTVAIILLRKYEKDQRLTTFVELGYSIILKYSLFLMIMFPYMILASISVTIRLLKLLLNSRSYNFLILQHQLFQF